MGVHFRPCRTLGSANAFALVQRNLQACSNAQVHQDPACTHQKSAAFLTLPISSILLQPSWGSIFALLVDRMCAGSKASSGMFKCPGSPQFSMMCNFISTCHPPEHFLLGYHVRPDRLLGSFNVFVLVQRHHQACSSTQVHHDPT